MRSYRNRRVRYAAKVSVISIVLAVMTAIVQRWAAHMVSGYHQLRTDLVVSVYVFVLVMFFASIIWAVGAWMAAIFDDC